MLKKILLIPNHNSITRMGRNLCNICNEIDFIKFIKYQPSNVPLI